MPTSPVSKTHSDWMCVSRGGGVTLTLAALVSDFKPVQSTHKG